MNDTSHAPDSRRSPASLVAGLAGGRRAGHRRGKRARGSRLTA
jgi:hypothetical protein